MLRTTPSLGNIVAFHRSAEVPKTLLDLKQEYKERLQCFQLDLQSQSSIDNAVSTLKNSGINSISLLINAAGILGGNSKDLGPERSIMNLEREWLEKSLQVNLIGHIMLTKTFVPFLKNNSNDDSGIHSNLFYVIVIDASLLSGSNSINRIVNISARVGSISDNKLGGWYSYRISKSGLNMFTKTASIELKRYNIAVISIHPGTTNTDLSKPFQKNVLPDKLFDVKDSVRMMLDVIWDLKLEDSGKFFAYDGSEIPF